MHNPKLFAPIPAQDRLLTVEDLAKRWTRSPHTIRSDASRAPHSLPPIVRLPGHNGLRFRLSAVEQFEAAAEVTAPPPCPKPAKRRGRPTKAESHARRAGMTS